MKNKLRFKVLILPLILLFVFLVLGIALTVLGVQNIWQQEEHNILVSQQRSIQKTMRTLETRALTVASLAAALPGVEQAYDLALAGKESQGRALLRKSTDRLHQVVTRWLEVKQFKLHYHLPPAKSFLRIWRKPGRKDGGDDLTSFRKTVLAVNRDQKPVRGIEIGRGGFVVRGLVPVFSVQGKHLGSVESLVDFKTVCRLARTTPQEQVASYMEEKGLSIARRLAAKKPPRVGRFVLYYSTKRDFTDPVIDSKLLEKAFKAPVQMRRGDMLVAALPIKDFSGTPKGVLVFVRDITSLIDSMGAIRNGLIIGGVILLLVLSVLFYLSSNSVVSLLTRAIGGLNRTTDHVQQSAQQMAEASQRLAEGSSQQASSLEETSASLEEISSMTQANQENAGEADNLMQEGGKLIGEAGESMEEMAKAMQQLAASGEEISKVIKSIDEIAFQTNLLALNAAVEAARAGEAGAGFAVVADEVRNLAMRSAEAARDTQNMIEGTVKAIDKGSALVNRSRDDFQRITELMQRVAVLVSEISSASQEQTQGLNEINQAVHQVDKVVQGNAADAQETAESASHLAEQARSLRRLVDQLSELIGQQQRKQSADRALPAQEVKLLE